MHTDFRNPPRFPDQGGFALALVVFFLFAILLMAGAGYQIISMEALQSKQSLENSQALAVAQGGLEWFMGQQGTIPDSVTYSINGGTALITTRKVAAVSEGDLYLVRSRGSYVDPRFPEMPAIRVVAQYATFQKVPLNVMAPVMTSAPRTRVRQNGVVSGNDLAPVGSCSNATGATLAGVVTMSNLQVRSGGQVIGSPQGLRLMPFARLVDSVNVEWDMFTDPTFPVDYDDEWPDFSGMPADSFPVVRVNGDFSPTSSRSGRGLLIVTGTLHINDGSSWSWSGIVMAGDMDDVGRDSGASILGALVAGQGDQMGNLDIDGGTFQYHSCNVERAGASLSSLTPVENSWWEDTG